MEWLDDNSFVKALFAGHTQLIRRSGDVLGFLCRERALSAQHLDIIWAAGGGGQDKDRRICVHEVTFTAWARGGVLFVSLAFFWGGYLVHVDSNPSAVSLPHRTIGAWGAFESACGLWARGVWCVFAFRPAVKRCGGPGRGGPIREDRCLY